VETFKNPEGNRNEALDLLVGNLAAFRHTRWDFETIERTMRDDAEALRTPNAKPKPEIDYPIFEGGQMRSGWL
jgi:phage terminase large subunit GpA-like protein